MISWKGLTEYQAKLRASARKLREKSKQDVERWGRGVEAQAKANAPVDLGKLRQSISYEPTNGGMGAKVSVNVAYAAFIEFGTGAGVLVPPGWAEVAIKFKGTRGRRVTISAHPYFVPAVKSETEKLKARLRYNLKTLL